MRAGEEFVEIRTTQILISLGVHASSMGFVYMRRCIIETYYDADITLCVTKTLYPRVSTLCKAGGADVVARTCRRAVTNVLKKAPPSVQRCYFGVEPYRINCSQFFSAVADYLHRECDEIINAQREETLVTGE